VVMDQARPHTSKKTKAYVESQPRLHTFYGSSQKKRNIDLATVD
jgi:hypothetical protein